MWLPYGVEEFRVGEMEVTLGMMLELFILLMLKPIVDILKRKFKLTLEILLNDA